MRTNAAIAIVKAEAEVIAANALVDTILLRSMTPVLLASP